MNSPVQESFENFENLKFDPLELKDVLLDDSNDSDKNFYNNIQAVDTEYYLPSELLSLSEKLHINSEKYFMIHLNIRSARENSEKLKDFLSQTGSFFKVLYLTETWFSDRNSESSFYQLPQYTAVHQQESFSYKPSERWHKHVHP